MPLAEIAPGDDRALQEVADLIARSKKVLVITGAGISTSCGIPDFRSKDGLYNLIPEQNCLLTPPPSAPSTPSRKRKAYTTDDTDSPPSSQSSATSTSSRRSSSVVASKLRGQDLFNASVWKTPASTATFYQFIAALRQKISSDVKETSLTHKFIRTLRDSGRLMRCYTQNIDGLEARDSLCMDLSRGKGNKRRFMKKSFEAPLPEQTRNTDFDGGCEVVPLHGDLEKLRCTLCQETSEWSDEATEEFFAGHALECEKCASKSDRRQANGKRGLSVGSLRPNIVLYGEEHPENTLITPLIPFDSASGPEVLIIMGTSLKVFGLQKIVRDFAKAVHSTKGKGSSGRVIFINRTRPAESIWEGIIDNYVAMDCDDWVADLNERRSDLSLRQSAIDRKVTKAGGKRKRETSELDQNPILSKKTNFVVEIPRTGKKTVKKPKITISEDATQEPQQGVASATSGFNEGGRGVGRKAHSDTPLLSALMESNCPKLSPINKQPKELGLAETGTLKVDSTLRFLWQHPTRSPVRPPYSPLSPYPAPLPKTPNTAKKIMSRIWIDVTTSCEGNNEIEIAESDLENEKNSNFEDDGEEMNAEEVEEESVPETPSRRGRDSISKPHPELLSTEKWAEIRDRMDIDGWTGENLRQKLWRSLVQSVGGSIEHVS